jgi:hypothetical protein
MLHLHFSTFLEYITQKLNVPQKGLPTADLYKSQTETSLTGTPKYPAFIGVGYKDKGALTLGHVCKLPSPDFRPEPYPIFDQTSLIKLWQTLREQFN